MGIANDISKRVSGFFKKDKDVANLQLAKGATAERLDGSAIDMLTGLGYDALSQYLRLDQDLLQRFADYEEMDDYGEIACLTGNSEVGVLGASDSGIKYLTVAELLRIRVEQPDRKLYTLAVDLAGQKVVPALINGPVLSGKQAPVFRVTYTEYRANPGQPKKEWTVRATGNHPFMLRDGTYKTVARLVTGDRLMAVGFARTKAGYLQVRDLFKTRGGKSLYDYLHRLIGEHILSPGVPLGSNDIIHHLDEDPTNNDPANLQVMSRADHTRDHAPTQTPEIRARLSEVAKARRSDPEEAARWAASQRRVAPEQHSNPAPKGILSDAHRAAIAKGHTLPLAKDIVEHALRSSPSISAAARSLKTSDSTIVRRMVRYSLDPTIIGTSPQRIHVGDAAYSNHVVVSVEPDGFDDVYDIEVPGYRNFLVAGGVFVHNTALDILADDSTQPDGSLNRTVWVTSKDKTLQQNIDDLFNRTLRLDEEIWEIARTLCKYGNEYEEILVNKEGVRGLNYLPPATVRRIEGQKGDLLGFIQDFKGRFDYSPNDYQNVLQSKFGNPSDSALDPNQQAPLTAFEPWEVVHWRLRGKERRSVYGHSALESARWIWKRLMLLEDAALVYRLQRAPERFAFYVDVGDLPPKEALAFVNRVRQNFRKKKFVDPSSGKLNLKFDALAQDEDFFVPSRKGVDSTRIETLGAPQWQAMEDVEYFRDKLFAAIKVPKAYLGQEAGVNKAVLSSEDVRFARTVLRIQRELKNGLRKLVRVHLSALNIDPYAVDYDIHMTVPSAIFELAQMEVRTAKADLAGRMRDFVSLHWILSRVFGLSEDEIKDIQKERKKEALDDAKLQGEAQQLGMPPEMGADMQGASAGDSGDGGQQGTDAPPEGAEPEGAYGPPPEEGRRVVSSQMNLVERRIHASRTRAFNRGIPTRNGISDRELFEGKRSEEHDRRMEERLAQLLQNDKGMELRLRELGGLLRDLRHATSRRP